MPATCCSTRRSRTRAAGATALYGTDLGDLSWSGTRVVLDTAPRFGIDASWSRWIELRPGGDDSLSTGDASQSTPPAPQQPGCWIARSDRIHAVMGVVVAGFSDQETR